MKQQILFLREHSFIKDDTRRMKIMHRVRWLRLMGLIETISIESPWVMYKVRKIVRLR